MNLYYARLILFMHKYFYRVQIKHGLEETKIRSNCLVKTCLKKYLKLIKTVKQKTDKEKINSFIPAKKTKNLKKYYKN